MKNLCNMQGGGMKALRWTTVCAVCALTLLLRGESMEAE